MLTEEYIVHGNVLLEGFMGFTTHNWPDHGLMVNVKSNYKVYLTNWEKTLFHCSMDWLWPVFIEFNKIYGETTEYVSGQPVFKVTGEVRQQMKMLQMRFYAGFLEYVIEECYTAMVEFVELWQTINPRKGN